MNYLITVSFANRIVAEKSYARMVETMKDDPCKVLLWDNCYPQNSFTVLEICRKYGFEYNSCGENIGAYAAVNRLIESLPPDCEKVIIFDGDNFPLEDNWHKALFDVIGGDIIHSTLTSEVNFREMNERGFEKGIVNGYNVKIPKDAVSCTVSAFSVPWLKSIGGITEQHLYYGGNEIAMKPFYKDKRWVILEDYHEGDLKYLHDWQYEQYKMLYAHKGMDISFDEYLKQQPDKIEDLAKYIFP